jgi:hypothetical protein
VRPHLSGVLCVLAADIWAGSPATPVLLAVVAFVLGVLMPGETMDADGPQVFVLIAAAALVIISTIALARGEAATMAAAAGRDVAIAENAPSNSSVRHITKLANSVDFPAIRLKFSQIDGSCSRAARRSSRCSAK